MMSLDVTSRTKTNKLWHVLLQLTVPRERSPDADLNPFMSCGFNLSLLYRS